jgi:hypothetical protein
MAAMEYMSCPVEAVAVALLLVERFSRAGDSDLCRRVPATTDPQQ